MAQVRRTVKKNHAINKNYAACSLWYTVVYYGISYVYWQNCKIIVKGQCPTDFPTSDEILPAKTMTRDFVAEDLHCSQSGNEVMI